MRHEAIYSLYPNVVSIDDGAGAFDAESNPVQIDEEAVAAEIERLKPIVIRRNASLSRMEFMLALEEAGLYDEAEATVDSDQIPKAAKIMWRNASAFNRMDETLVQFATSLGYTDEQMDQLFGIEVDNG